MVEQVSRLAVAFDPLIAEAKQRMRRRRFGLASILLAAAGLTIGLTLALRPLGPVGPQDAAPGFYRVNWSGPIKVNGRPAIGATIYWVRVSRSHWAVKASVANLTRHTLQPVRRPMDTGWGMGAVTAGECSGSTCFTSRAASFSPALPRKLRPGARWTGVFSGTAEAWGKVPRNLRAGFSLGYYLGWPKGCYVCGGGFGIGTPKGWAVHIR
jgi:hypothetical protein